MDWMRNNRLFGRRFIALLASFAVLLGAIAPTISHAMSSEQAPPGMMKVCTSLGTKFIPVNFIVAKTAIKTTQSLPTSRSTKPESAMSACGYCDQHAGTHSIITYANVQVSDADLPHNYTAFTHAHPRSFFHTSPPSPRGPPAFLS